MGRIVSTDVVHPDREAGKWVSLDVDNRVTSFEVVIVRAGRIRGTKASTLLLNITELAHAGLLSVDNTIDRKALRGMQKLSVYEEKGLVFEDGTANAETRNMLDELRPRCWLPIYQVLFIGGIVSVEPRGLIEPKDFSVKFIGARTCFENNLATTSHAKLS